MTRRSILLLSLAAFCSMAAQRICDPMLPELSRVFAVGLPQAAQVVSMFALAYGVAQLVYGPLGDRLGKFRIIAWATLACGVGSMLAVLAGNLTLLVLARVATGLAAAAIIPLTLAWIGDNVRSAQVQETIARVALGTTMGAGAGQLIGGLLTQSLGWRWAFVFLALLFGTIGLMLLVDWRRQHAQTQRAMDLAAQAAAAPSGDRRRASFFDQTWSIVGAGWPRVVLLTAFVEGVAGFGVMALWAAHLQGALGLSASASGAIVALFGVGGLAYLVIARHMIARLGQAGLSMAGGCLMGASALLLAFAPVWPLGAAASLLAGFGFSMFHNTMQANAAQMAPAARGTAVSLFASSLFLGQSVGATLAASMITLAGSRSIVALGGVVMIAVGLLFGAALRRRAAADPGA